MGHAHRSEVAAAKWWFMKLVDLADVVVTELALNIVELALARRRVDQRRVSSANSIRALRLTV